MIQSITKQSATNMVQRFTRSEELVEDNREVEEMHRNRVAGKIVPQGSDQKSKLVAARSRSSQILAIFVQRPSKAVAVGEFEPQLGSGQFVRRSGLLASGRRGRDKRKWVKTALHSVVEGAWPCCLRHARSDQWPWRGNGRNHVRTAANVTMMPS